MESPSSSFPLRTQLSFMSNGTRVLLEYYFNNTGKSLYKHVSEQGKADCIIIDYDHPGAKDEIESKTTQLKTPYIVLSFSDLDFNNVTVINKPLSMQKLDVAAEDIVRILHKTQTNASESEPAEFIAPSLKNKATDTSPIPTLTTIANITSSPKVLNITNPFVTNSKENHHLKPFSNDSGRVIKLNASVNQVSGKLKSSHTPVKGSQTDRKRELLCGANKDTSISLDNRYSGLSFQKQNHLSGYFCKALQEIEGSERAFTITTPSLTIYALPSENRVYTNNSLKDTKILQHAFNQLDPGDVSTHFSTNNNLPLPIRGTHSGYAYSLEAFNWLIALLSAKGRLPQNLNLEAPMRLKHWPNFTRVENTPYCFQLAALWSQDFKTLEMIKQELNIQPRYVTTFFNGALALDLFEFQDKIQLEKKRGFFDFFRSRTNES